MAWLPAPVSSRERAAALLIVLAFVVLLTGLSVAYLSRTTDDRQVAHSSFNQSNADQLAQSAMDNIIGDLRQEIADPAGSTSSIVNVNGVDITIYTPTSAAYMVPQRNVNLTGVYNLIRRSDRSDPLVAPARPSRASAVNSMTDVSANGRYVTSTRWNGHYLIPKGDVNTSDPSPTPTFDAVTPDWVFVTAAGATPSPAPADVIGRYAYAIYDEGGLLDANLVGLPSPTPGGVTIASPSPSRTVYPSRKGTVAFADLTALPLTPGGSTPNPLTISRMVGWRNYATTLVPTNKAFPDLSPSPTEFVTYFANNSRDFLTVSPTLNTRGRTDQAFTTRSQLIQLVLSSLGASPNLLQYLGTFSRELNSPTWQSASNPISQRFQLDKISLLAPTPPPTANVAAIQAYFGLHWSTLNNRWQYWGQGSSLASAISPPAPTGSPAPDFFQILNYAIPGQTIATILSLGACIIDQYDFESPQPVITAIEYGPAAVPQPVAWGMEGAGATPMGSGSPSPTPWPPPTPPAGYVVLQQPFQSVGELGYAYNPITGQTLDFKTSGSPAAALLDFFTYNTTDNTATYNLPYPLRAGSVNINTRNSAVIAALIKGAFPNWPPTTAGVSPTPAANTANLITTATGTQPAMNRQDIARLASAVGNTIGSTEEPQETVARVLSDTTQTRTWGLLIDVIAQSGRFKPNAASLQNDFVVEGEQHYWVHVAIDRFTGQVIDKQIEVVTE
jgi:Tfp pilus assembly protein PilX